MKEQYFLELLVKILEDLFTKQDLDMYSRRTEVISFFQD